jgi:5-methylcytosine-specific restriction endonuclease McrA
VIATPSEPLGFAQLLIGLLDEGRRTATYKLAVLLALMDTCTLGTDENGCAASRVSTRDLARRVVELYWPQVRPHPDAGVLRQSTQLRAVTPEAVRKLRETGAATPHLAERHFPMQYEKCLEDAELNLVRMPLGKLQRPLGFREHGGIDYPRFLYEDSAFHEGVTARQLRSRQLYVDLQPGVADWLVSLSGLLRPLLELHWTRAVAQYNKQSIVEDRLREFLFGAGRVPLQKIAPGLREAQRGECFYCGAPLQAGEVEVDHFVPWSRIPNDALGNLVLADRGCNNGKRDHLAALPHLERWAARSVGVLTEVADDTGWPLQLTESARVARGVYAHLPPGTHLWSSRRTFDVLDPAQLRAVLPLLETA